MNFEILEIRSLAIPTYPNIVVVAINLCMS